MRSRPRCSASLSCVRTETRVIAYIAIAAGSIAMLFGACAGESKVAQAGAAIVVAGLALFGVAAGLATWQEERRKARELHQREAYTALVQHTFARFNGTSNSAAEATVRAQAAVWGNAAVVQKLAAWNEAYDNHVPAAPTGQLVTLTPEGRKAVRTALADLIVAVRQDLAPGDSVKSEEVVHALFNQADK